MSPTTPVAPTPTTMLFSLPPKQSLEYVKSLTTSLEDLEAPSIIKQAVLNQRCNSLIKVQDLSPAASKKMPHGTTGMLWRLCNPWSKCWMVSDGASLVLYQDWKWFVRNRKMVANVDVPVRMISFKFLISRLVDFVGVGLSAQNEPKGVRVELDHAVAFYDPLATYRNYFTFSIHFLKSGQTINCRTRFYDEANQWIKVINYASAYWTSNLTPLFEKVVEMGLGSWVSQDADLNTKIRSSIELVRRTRPKSLKTIMDTNTTLQTLLNSLRLSHLTVEMYSYQIHILQRDPSLPLSLNYTPPSKTTEILGLLLQPERETQQSKSDQQSALSPIKYVADSSSQAVASNKPLEVAATPASWTTGPANPQTKTADKIQVINEYFSRKGDPARLETVSEELNRQGSELIDPLSSTTEIHDTVASLS
eukprot:jgi/Hompol1/651/HPOL_001484-RA